MIDLHSHTKYSPDSKEEPEKHILKAINSGLKVFGFSEHLDYDYIVNNMEVIKTDVKAYYENTCILKEKYKDKIKLLCGIEFGYAYNAEQEYINILKKYNFDYVINSVHVVGNKDCYFQSYFEGKTKKESYLSYLKNVLLSVNAKFDFQIIGHIGYVIRNAPYKNSMLNYKEFKNIIDDILISIIEKQKVLEINTNIKRNDTKTLPTYEIVKRYYDLGGKLVTFGSDCHQAQRLGENYNFVKDMLLDIGFKQLIYFENKIFKTYSLK